VAYGGGECNECIHNLCVGGQRNNLTSKKRVWKMDHYKLSWEANNLNRLGQEDKEEILHKG